ncbi:hypothetical protein AGMMS49949_08460 [Alphaproteobacteria bacterium]|nr:hypothetical protein AGMMS49949_08460 [Alphaproteobacteria bacterium]
MDIKSDQDYDLLEVPGSNPPLYVAVLLSMHHGEDDENSGTNYWEWTIMMDLLLGSLLAPQTALFGWFAESSRSTGPDVGNQLFTSASVRHSELVVVISDTYLPKLESKLVKGDPIKEVIIQHAIQLGGLPIPIPVPVPIQINIFSHCYITSVQRHLDYLIVSLRVGAKRVVCTAFDQKGMPKGVGTYEIDFRTYGQDALGFF